MVDLICSPCWYEREIIVHNVNDLCDRCGGSDWIEAGHVLEDTGEIEVPTELPPEEEEEPVILSSQDHNRLSAMNAVAGMREHPHYSANSVNSERFWKDGER